MITFEPLRTMTLRLKKPLDVGAAPADRRTIAEIPAPSCPVG